ncbi:hypothetical protein ACTA71_011728 [Dictyostelium dimigraforme]
MLFRYFILVVDPNSTSTSISGSGIKMLVVELVQKVQIYSIRFLHQELAFQSKVKASISEGFFGCEEHLLKLKKKKGIMEYSRAVFNFKLCPKELIFVPINCEDPFSLRCESRGIYSN